MESPFRHRASAPPRASARELFSPAFAGPLLLGRNGAAQNADAHRLRADSAFRVSENLAKGP
jgi:hypothetical protein